MLVPGPLLALKSTDAFAQDPQFRADLLSRTFRLLSLPLRIFKFTTPSTISSLTLTNLVLPSSTLRT